VAAAAAASRGAPSSGEVEAGDNGWGGSVVSVGARGGEGRFNLARGRPEIGARRGWPKGAGVRLGCGGEGRCAEVKGSSAFIGAVRTS
jgi:hypothetical protein